MNNSLDHQLLEDTPEMALRFLRAIAIKAEIRIAMHACGYTDQEQANGWQLLLNANGYVPADVPFANDRNARAAMAEVDAWDDVGFRRMRAALSRLHPEQAEFVFAGVTPGQGAESVVAVATVLDRLDALENAPAREGTRAQDHAALATLAQRGIDAVERARLRQLVTLAQGAGLPTAAEGVLLDTARRAEALVLLQAWYADWSETAKAVIRRRDYLVMLGLVKRRTTKKEIELDVAEPTVTV